MTITAFLAVALGAAPIDTRMVRFPAIHGDQVVFTYASDLWTTDTSGSIARRLTSFPGSETRASFSPDGKWIAFSASFEGAGEVYVMPSQGGEPKRLTFEPTNDAVLGWTPDGKIAYTSGNGTPSNRQSRLWYVSPNGGMPIATDINECWGISYSPDGGKQAAFVRVNSFGFNWRGYRGGTQGRIAIWDFAKRSCTELPSGREQSYFPMWLGDSIYYISDKNLDNINLYRYNTNSKRAEQVTKFNDGDIKMPNTDGKSIIWERNGKIELFDSASSSVKNFVPMIVSDGAPMRPRFRRFGDQISTITLSPNGKRVAVDARGEIFSVPATSGETRNLSNTPGARERFPSWSVDGQYIICLSDRTGENKITLLPQMGGEAKVLKTPDEHHILGFSLSATGKYITYNTSDRELYYIPVDGGTPQLVFKDNLGIGNFDWAPDDSMIVYTKSNSNLFSSIHIYNLATKQSKAVTDGFYNDTSVSFDLSGKYLYFVSARTYGFTGDAFQGPNLFQDATDRIYMVPLSKDAPNPLLPPVDEETTGKAADGGDEKPAGGGKVDFDGIMSRVITLPLPNSSYPFVIGARNGVYTFTADGLVKFDLASKSVQPILAGANQFSFNASGSKIAYKAGPVIGIVGAQPGGQAGQGRVSTTDVAFNWDPKAEYSQIFWEAWRYQRDTFYDKNMVGLDWNAVGRKYAAMLPSVSDRQDLNYILGMMIGELGTGHAYITALGDTEVTTVAPVGMLGVDYAIEGGKIKLAKIYRGYTDNVGPLGALGVEVKDGEYLLAINGKPVNANTSVSELLVDKVNKIVTLTVSPSPSGAGREVKVKPIGNEAGLRYDTWVEERRQIIDKLSGGRIGYMHVPNTGVEGIIGFMKGFYSQSGKEAFIIDERFNGGGFIPTFFVEFLQRKMITAMYQRGGAEIGFPTQSLDGPKVMLVNEYAGSGGDMFPWLFKNAELGPLIGKRTWGGLVGINGSTTLVDGGGVTSPGFGIFDTIRGEWIAENKGVDPDIDIDNDPASIARGEDKQLEAGVKYLLDQLKQGKGRKPFKRPELPKIKTSKGG